MHDQTDLWALAAVIVVALIAGAIFTRLRQPALVGYLLSGIVLGPSGLAVVESREHITFLADLGILLLLFIVGMELSLRSFRAVWRLAVAAATLQVAGAVGVMALVAYGLGWSIGQTVLLGFVVAISSTAVVIKVLEDINLLRTQIGQTTVSVLIAQDLAIVPMLLVIGLLTEGDVGVPTEAGKIALSIALLAGLVWYLSRRAMVRLPFSRVIAASAELRPLYGIAVCFGAATLTGLLGLSTVYGAFLAGLVVGNSNARRTLLRSVRPIETILVMVFFVSIGLLIDLDFVWRNLGTVLLIIFIVTVGKTAMNIGVFLVLREPWLHAVISGLMLAQIGEFSFMLGGIGLSRKLIDAEAFQLVVSVTAFTLIVSPLWLAMARRMMRIAISRAATMEEIYRRLRDGGLRACWRAARDRPLPSALAFRLFGKPRSVGSARAGDDAATSAPEPHS